MPKNRVTLREIAERVGVTRMAVSLALRGKPGVSAATRDAILKAADDLGYVPDPEIAKLMARIRARGPGENQASIAMLFSGDSPDAWKKSLTESKYVRGAVQRAGSLGYGVDPFWFDDPSMTPARLGDILWSRGIEGVIICPLQRRLGAETSRELDFDLERFAAVAISETFERPVLDRVLHDQYGAVGLCLGELGEMGYRKPGLVLEAHLDRRVGGRWTASFIHHRMTKNPELPPPLLIHRNEEDKIDQWFDEHRPDVIISVNRFGLDWLQRREFRIPEEIGYVSLDLDGLADAQIAYSGVNQNSLVVGSKAVDLLITALQVEQSGTSRHPVRLEVCGDWISGDSTRPQKIRTGDGA